jgi:murein DD-endopeptidase MepM/ murein hydrolase activator NlpD
MNNKISPFFTMICISLCLVASTPQAAEIQYCFPVQPVDKAAFSDGGHSYPAIDIFGKRGCTFVAPVSGVVEDLQKNDEWDKKVNDPDKKGGKWVSLRGDDGFRYYGSHLESVSEKIRVGQRLQPGDVLGYIGNSGNAQDTPAHLHFGISYASTPYSWQTRRGEIVPYHFLRCILRDGCNPQAMLPQ